MINLSGDPMRQDKKKIYNQLLEYQQRFGGYTGKDLDETARIFGLNKRTLKRNVEKWSKTDPLFLKSNVAPAHPTAAELRGMIALALCSFGVI